jgi:hypothetical protein
MLGRPQVVSPQFSTNVVASVGWGIFGVKDTSRFPYWFYFPQRRKEQVRQLSSGLKGSQQP